MAARLLWALALSLKTLLIHQLDDACSSLSDYLIFARKYVTGAEKHYGVDEVALNYRTSVTRA